MRQRFLFVFFLLVSAFLSGPAQARSLVNLSDTQPRQGSIVRVQVYSPDCFPKVHWNGESLQLSRNADRRIGYFGVDLEAETGRKHLRLEDSCEEVDYPERIPVQVHEGQFSVQRLTVEDTGKVQLSEENLRRHRQESRLIDAALNRRSDTRYWDLPFHPPVPEGQFVPNNSFGSRRIINGRPRSPHSGEDYTARTGDPVYAINDGKISLTGNFFFSGKGVFIDHGQGLTSMYFHLSEIDVQEGKFVRAGTRLGSAGATGRVTGPHLHLGVQWRGARVDPDPLFFGSEGIVTEND